MEVQKFGGVFPPGKLGFRDFGGWQNRACCCYAGVQHRKLMWVVLVILQIWGARAHTLAPMYNERRCPVELYMGLLEALRPAVASMACCLKYREVAVQARASILPHIP